MIWQSTTLMTVIDIVILGIVGYAAAGFLKGRGPGPAHRSDIGSFAILGGLLVVALFYLTDLLAMHAAPSFMSRAEAMAIMRELHLNGSWVVALLGIGAICFGFTSVNRATAALVGDLEERERDLGLELAERKRIERSLRESRDQMRLITDNLPFAISYLDNEGRYRFVNRTVETWFDRPAKELFGQTIRDVLGQEAHDAVTPQVVAALRGEAQHDERVIGYPDGKTRTVELTYVPDIDETETIRGCFAFAQDITERKRAEAALRESEALFRAFVDNIPVEIAIRDTEGRFLFVNAAWENDEGPTKEQIIGMTVHEVYSKEGADLYQSQDRAVLDTGQVVDQVVEVPAMPGRGVNPNPITMHTIKFPIRDARGDITKIGAIGINITERKQAEQEIQKLNEDLERRVEERTAELRAAQDTLLRNERLSTLGQLTATVSHELRNPLGVIRTSAFTLRGKLVDGEPSAERTLDRIERNVVRCDRIIDELLDFTRISQIEPERTSLDDWLKDTLNEQTLPAGVALQLALAQPDVAVSLDRDRFRRAIINIFDNACQAMIGYGNEDANPEAHTLTVRTQVSDRRVEVIFLDTGPGIPSDIHEKIFEPMYSTKGFGVGLGLPVVKQIMEQHGGGIKIESEEGRGTRVCLWLPTGPATR